MFDTQFNYANITKGSDIYGPGKRYVIWLQGCTLGCKGCWNTDMWPHKEKNLIDREALFIDILSVTDISGVTILGGEPLEQCENVLWLLNKLQSTKFDCMLYSGYSYSEILGNALFSQVLKLVDIMVTGRFELSLRDVNLRWRGSTNQEVLFFTDKYKAEDYEECNEVEIHIGEFGEIDILGYPSVKLYEKLLDK
ncbi:4Fe-4S single cluster domain-containing protein [Psychromonas sp. KJ10-2]|uniref:4Fe-4S single cluster domain-containing protein n=1 Tax=Psychromonas sp. KJ10-2 TaxID=3391822 RepID=UPI0039B41A69